MSPPSTSNEKTTLEERGNEYVEPITTYAIFKNLAAISIGSLLIISTANVLEVYQSTLNVEKGVGIASLAVQYASSVLAALLLPKYLIRRFGNKAVIILSMIAFIPFVVVNYYPLYPLMILSSVFIGVGFTMFMGAIDPYVNDLATAYTQLVASESEQLESYKSGDAVGIYNDKDIGYLPYSISDTVDPNRINTDCVFLSKIVTADKSQMSNSENFSNADVVHSAISQKSRIINTESTTNRFFGVYAMIYQSSFTWGSLMAFYVLQNGYTDSSHDNDVSNETCLCGATYCTDKAVCLAENLQQPTTETRDLLISICLGLCAIAIVVIIAFFGDLKPKNKNVTLSLQMLFATFRQTQKKNHLLLIPLTMYIGMIKAFYLTDFTKSYVGCAWGISHVGLVTAFGGGTVALSSTVSGYLVRYVGRRPVFSMVAALNVGLNVMLHEWKPDPEMPEMFFVAAVIWGAVFGSFYTLTKALYGVLFKEDEEAAFGAYQVWQCVGSCLSLTYSNRICNNVKLYILTAVCTLGMIGYYVVEKHHGMTVKEQSFQASTIDFASEELADTPGNEIHLSHEIASHL